MQVNRFNFALKWALILAGISLISTMPFLFSSDEFGAGPSVLSIVLSVLSFFAGIVVITIAIIKYAKANDHKVSPSDIWAFSGLLVLMTLVINVVLMIVTFSIKGVEESFGLREENMSGDLAAGMITFFIFFTSFIYFLIFLLAPITIAGQWRTYEKGGKPGWACIIPIYNYVCIAEMGKRPTWWVVMLFIPFVNIVFIIMLLNGMVKAFGKDGGWTAGLIFLPFAFYPMLAWGDAQYQFGDFENNDRNVEDHLVE